MHTHKDAHTCTYTHAHTHIYIYIHAHTHTHTHTHTTYLVAHVDAADSQHGGEARQAAGRKGVYELGDKIKGLARELPRRAEDQADGAFAAHERGSKLLLEGKVEERKHKYKRLARPRRSDADHVAACERNRQPYTRAGEYAE